MRRLAISDIHGLYARFMQVLEVAGFDSAADRLFVLGDMIDRGPDSKLVVDKCRELQGQGHIILKGNHEHMCILTRQDYCNWNWWMGNGGTATVESFGGMPAHSYINWFELLPHWHEEPDLFLVHAGVEEDIELDEQELETLLWIRGHKSGYKGKHVVYGHTPTISWPGKDTPWISKRYNCTCIDTGGVFEGGKLTLFDLDTHEFWQS